jgi:hypothetical protein
LANNLGKVVDKKNKPDYREKLFRNFFSAFREGLESCGRGSNGPAELASCFGQLGTADLFNSQSSGRVAAAEADEVSSPA